MSLNYVADSIELRDVIMGLLKSLVFVTIVVSVGQQREMAALWAGGAPVPGANYYIHLSQQATVVNAIREVVQASRRGTPVRFDSIQPGCPTWTG